MLFWKDMADTLLNLGHRWRWCSIPASCQMLCVLLLGAASYLSGLNPYSDFAQVNLPMFSRSSGCLCLFDRYLWRSVFLWLPKTPAGPLQSLRWKSGVLVRFSHMGCFFMLLFQPYEQVPTASPSAYIHPCLKMKRKLLRWRVFSMPCSHCCYFLTDWCRETH